jgi:PBP1b-binding outer membrane lipoprotein LpoB
MKRLAMVVIVVVMLAGCSYQSGTKSYYTNINEALKVIIPHHIELVTATPKYTEDEKKVMIKAAEEVLKLSQEAVDQSNK